jgi:hypothetical protein
VSRATDGLGSRRVRSLPRRHPEERCADAPVGMGDGPAAAATPDRNCGMVTAETALALPALALVVGLMLWALLAATAQLRCVDAARAAARSVARGDGQAESVAAGLRLAPEGAHIRVERSGGLVRVNVEAMVGPAGSRGGFLPTLAVSADAVVPDEQG